MVMRKDIEITGKCLCFSGQIKSSKPESKLKQLTSGGKNKRLSSLTVLVIERIA